MQQVVSHIDYQPIINALTQLAATVLLSVGVWAVQRWGASNSAQANATQQATYDAALKKSIASAFDDTAKTIKTWGSDHPLAVTALVDSAAQIMLERFPQTARAVGAKTPADLSTGIRRVLATLPVIPAQGSKP